MELAITREDMGIRLIEERTRLGYTQANFAHQTEISREALRLNELGRSGISAEFLGRAAQLGVDVQYVITGVRSQSLEDREPVNMQHSFKGDKNNVIYGDKGVINSGTINNITTEKYTTKTKAIIEPTDKHISEETARRLQDLVKEIVELEQKVKASPKTFQAVWASLNKHCGVATYRQIPVEKTEKAITYLRKWIGRLSSSKSAPKKIGNEWRSKKYAYIKINTKGLEQWLSGHLQQKYLVESITELTDEQLQKVYQSVASKKRSASK
ncbi:helix-turn-helix domain-containing protein [Mannheimia haemolytica]|uniref:helix-turn-helix domain-containing protein n=1 Tax=Mannheimia haemolytica TaxID=75985 RepID=UPI0001BCF7FC|nr:ORF6C domain-containing protein [Mannheimia haemolytica]AGI35954.1 transcriptional regulator [Mannheimia haemolytica USDA-ARS-USMARC-185]AJE07777.1 transcriptional regulator [Mannheimia haemolytica USDA-ARS-USMARC-184]EEY08716.1 putative DNA-binding protein [Mannheimia haemolytica serotype A2 str. OVINE]EEY13346.1 putative DNA-binding protein [Mannheimia haemolytica serotype A2 str. BOVINE]KIX30182.1 DNA-binding protein [Mannheimia haemolytica]